MKPLSKSVQRTRLGHATPKPIFQQVVPCMSFPLFYLRHTEGRKLEFCSLLFDISTLVIAQLTRNRIQNFVLVVCRSFNYTAENMFSTCG